MELGPGLLGSSLFGLAFLDGADGIFYLLVGVFYYLAGLFLGFVQDVAAHLLDVFQLLFVAVRKAFQRLVRGADLG